MEARIPRFTAEASFYRIAANYGAFRSRDSGPGASSVAAQFASWDVGAWVARALWMMDCPAPFCGRDEYGRCHCLTVTGGFGQAQ